MGECNNCGCDTRNDPNYPHSELVAENDRLRALVGDAHAYIAARNLGEPAEALRVRLRDALADYPGEGGGND